MNDGATMMSLLATRLCVLPPNTVIPLLVLLLLLPLYIPRIFCLLRAYQCYLHFLRVNEVTQPCLHGTAGLSQYALDFLEFVVAIAILVVQL